MSKSYSNTALINYLCGLSNSKSPHLSPFKAYCIYKYGSHVYGTTDEHSDADVIMVSELGEDHFEYDYEDDLISCKVYSLSSFCNKLERHDIDALECIFLPEPQVIKRKLWFDEYFKLDKGKLRQSISQKASHSFVKAKKKLTVEEDYNERVGLKSLFHSLRIIDFGTQIAKEGRIIDYASANNYYFDILDTGPSWNKLHEKFKPIHNTLMTEFRKVAPKDE